MPSRRRRVETTSMKPEQEMLRNLDHAHGRPQRLGTSMKPEQEMLRNLVAVLIVDAFQLTSMKPEQEMLRNLVPTTKGDKLRCLPQ